MKSIRAAYKGHYTQELKKKVEKAIPPKSSDHAELEALADVYKLTRRPGENLF